MDNAGKKAIISIEMDQNSTFEIRFQGDKSLRLGLMGSLDFGKDFLKNEILKDAGVSGAEICRKNESEYNNSNTQELSKAEALKVYMDAFEIIQARLSAIAGTDDRTTYQVPAFIKQL